MQRCVPVDVDRMGLNFAAAFEKKMNDLMVTKTGAEVERNVFFIVSGIYWLTDSKQWEKLNNRPCLSMFVNEPQVVC